MHGMIPARVAHLSRRSRLRAWIRRFSLRDGETAVQVALGLGFCGIGLVLWGEGSTFAISDSYGWFQANIREDAAAGLLFSAGAFALVAPLLPWRWPSVLAAFVLGTLAGVTAMGFFLGNTLSIGAVVFTSPFATLSYWLMMKRAAVP